MKEKFYSLLHRLLIRNSSFRFKGKFLRKIWQATWNWSTKSYTGVIEFKLHGEKVKMNNGYPYPLYLNTFFNYNSPLIETVNYLYISKNRTIDYIDVGAAIGDTILLIFQRCPRMIHQYYCVEGDDEFFEYLKFNLQNHPNGKLFKSLVSGYENKSENVLQRTHSGTASAIGKEIVNATTLDELLLKNGTINNVDLIKIDVDGLDGKVINGAREIISRFKPVIIFEFHPIILKKTGNKAQDPFVELSNSGYRKFLFYDKYGHFNHFQFNVNESEILFLEELCLRGLFHDDWHYDVIALHDVDNCSLIQLAELIYSKKF